MLLLIALWSCKVKRTVSFLMFAYLLYNSGGWGSAGRGGIHTRCLSLPPQQKCGGAFDAESWQEGLVASGRGTALEVTHKQFI